jgi:hypothetical protein
MSVYTDRPVVECGKPIAVINLKRRLDSQVGFQTLFGSNLVLSNPVLRQELRIPANAT